MPKYLVMMPAVFKERDVAEILNIVKVPKREISGLPMLGAMPLVVLYLILPIVLWQHTVLFAHKYKEWAFLPVFGGQKM